MKITPSLIIRLSKTTSRELLEQLKNWLLEKPGIIEVMADLAVPHLVLVRYEPRTIHSQTILRIAQKQDTNARFISL
jgi:hypothetical protein